MPGGVFIVKPPLGQTSTDDRTGKPFRPSLFVTVTLPSYGPVRRDDSVPVDPTKYDYVGSRTVPLVLELHSLVDRRATRRAATDWLFPASGGGPLRESNWKRTVHCSEAVAKLGYSTLRVHDLRHNASLWLAPGADPKVVRAVLGHFSAAMTVMSRET